MHLVLVCYEPRKNTSDEQGLEQFLGSLDHTRLLRRTWMIWTDKPPRRVRDRVATLLDPDVGIYVVAVVTRPPHGSASPREPGTGYTRTDAASSRQVDGSPTPRSL